MEKSRVKILFPNRSTMVVAMFIWEEPDNEISLLNELTEIIERDNIEREKELRSTGDQENASSIPEEEVDG